MPDFAACFSESCTRRGTCARYRMVHGRRQTVGSFSPEGCEAHLEVEPPPASGRKLSFEVLSMEDADKRARGYWSGEGFWNSDL